MDRRKKYEGKRVVKPVSFSVEKDADLLAYVASLPDFSNWVKTQLRQEMTQNDRNAQSKDTQQ